MDDVVAALCVNAGKACDGVVAEIAKAHAAIANPHLRIAVVMLLSFYLSVLNGAHAFLRASVVYMW